MLQELLLHSDVMVRDAQDDHPVFRFALLLREGRVGLPADVGLLDSALFAGDRELRNKFILNQNECLH